MHKIPNPIATALFFFFMPQYKLRQEHIEEELNIQLLVYGLSFPRFPFFKIPQDQVLIKVKKICANSNYSFTDFSISQTYRLLFKNSSEFLFMIECIPKFIKWILRNKS